MTHPFHTHRCDCGHQWMHQIPDTAPPDVHQWAHTCQQCGSIQTQICEFPLRSLAIAVLAASVLYALSSRSL